MKITVSVNLGGFSFNIDEDAYSELKRYLKNLELHFAGEESSSEILSDIESRMSDLFRQKLTGYKQVINISDVNEIIAIMGSPEDISNNEGPSRKEKFSTPGPHRMYRDPVYWGSFGYGVTTWPTPGTGSISRPTNPASRPPAGGPG